MWICATVPGNYLYTTYIKVVTNEGWYLISRYASELIGSVVHIKYKTKGNHTSFDMDQT